MRAVTDLIRTHNVDIDPHLDREALVPLVSGPQRQGDVIVIPAAMAQIRRMPADATIEKNKVGKAGVPVVRGESGGNTHLLLAEGDVYFAFVGDTTPDSGPEALNIGVLTVGEGAVGYLAHPEHGYAGILPGTYVIKRQREQADEIRMVQD